LRISRTPGAATTGPEILLLRRLDEPVVESGTATRFWGASMTGIFGPEDNFLLHAVRPSGRLEDPLQC
jgi:hypothetical protein